MNHCMQTPSAFNDLDDHGVFVLDLDPVSLPSSVNFEVIDMHFEGQHPYVLSIVKIDRSPVSKRLRCIVESYTPEDHAHGEPERVEFCLLHKFGPTLWDRYRIRGDELVLHMTIQGLPVSVLNEARNDLGLPTLDWVGGGL